jgi:hypothetical protein
MHVLLQNPWIKARIDAALAPYQNLVSPDDLAFLQDELAEVLSKDANGARALRRALPREDVNASGEAFVGSDAGRFGKRPGRVVGE